MNVEAILWYGMAQGVTWIINCMWWLAGLIISDGHIISRIYSGESFRLSRPHFTESPQERNPRQTNRPIRQTDESITTNVVDGWHSWTVGERSKSL
jgi:hypothetical protein